MIIAVASAPALSGCGGAEFGTVDPTMDPDAAGDTMTPSRDQNSTGGRGGTGGTGGKSGGGGSGGGGGTGGASGRGGGDSAVDGKIDGSGMSDDAPSDNGTPNPGDGRSGDVMSDGPPRTDVDAGQPSDAADVPTNTDAKDVKDASDASSRSDSDVAEGSADAVCSEPITYYRDTDGDGFGRYTEMMLSCPPPPTGWSATGGDCRDDLPNVKPFISGWPNPPLYAGSGYADAGKPQGVSFDYDCTGAEEADPANSYGLEPDCALLNCTGVGYVAVNPSRNGPGIDPRCGSMTLTRCNGNLLNCKSLPEATTIPYRCR